MSLKIWNLINVKIGIVLFVSRMPLFVLFWKLNMFESEQDQLFRAIEDHRK